MEANKALAKLLQIEQEARTLASEVDDRVPQHCARLIVGLACYLRTMIEMSEERTAGSGEPRG